MWKYFSTEDATCEPTQNFIELFKEELRIKVNSPKFNSEDSRTELKLHLQKVIHRHTLEKSDFLQSKVKTSYFGEL